MRGLRDLRLHRGRCPLLLTINGETKQLPAVELLPAVLHHLGIAGTVAVEVNGQLIRRTEQAEARIQEGDRLEIVHFVGGG